MANSRDMRVTFIGDTKGLETELRKVKGQLATVQKQVERGASGAKRSAEANAILGASFGSMAKRAAAGGAAIAATYFGISKAKDAISATEDLTHSTLTLNKSFGLSIKSASEWGAVIKARSVDGAAVGKSLTMSFKQFATQVHNAGTAVTGQSVALDKKHKKDQLALNMAAAQGKSLKQLTQMRQKLTLAETDSATKALKQVEAFKALGISQEELRKHGNDMNYMLHAVSDGLGRLPAGTDKAAIMAKLFGRTWVQIAPLIRDGSKALDEQLHKADEYGATLNGRILKQQERYIQSQREMQLANLGLKISFASIVTPALTSFNVLMAKVAKDLNGPGSFDDRVKRIGKDVHPALVKIEDEFHKELPKIASFAGHEAPKVAASFVKGFIDTDIWGKLALGGFLITKLKAWGPLFSKIGGADGLAWGGSFGKTAAAESAAATARGGEIGAAVASTSRWTSLGALAGRAFGVAAGIAITTEISQALENALHRSGPNKGGLQDNTSGGQFSLSEWAANLLGINQLKHSVGNGIPNALKNLSKSQSNYRDVARRSAITAGIDPDLFIRQIFQESGFNPNAVSSAGAIGIAQFMPSTARSLGVNPRNADASLEAAATLMAKYLAKYGSWAKALTAYNAGPGAVGKSLPNETKNYVSSILNTPTASGSPSTAMPGDLVWAKSMLGHFKESTGFNTGPELDQLQKEFGTHAAAWCAEFATKALVKAGFPKGVMTSSVSSINAMAKSGAYGLGFTTSPNPGGLVTFGNKHVAIVESVDRSKGVVHTIAGNTGKGEVSRSTYALGAGRYISADAAGAGVGAGSYGRPDKPTQIHTGSLTEADVLTFMQGRLAHFDLLVQAGKLSQVVADADKRSAIKATVPLLTGDNKLQALVALRALPTERGIERQGWKKVAAQYATNTSLNNPWLADALNHTDQLVGTGQLTQAQGDAIKTGYLKNALPSLSPAAKIAAQTQIHGMDPGAVAAEQGRLDSIDLHQRAGDLSSSDATSQKIASLKDALDNWTLTDDERLALRAELGDLTTALNDNTDATQKQLDMMQRDLDLTQQRLDQAARLARVAQNETSTLGRALLSFVNGGIGAQAGNRRGTPVAGSLGVQY